MGMSQRYPHWYFPSPAKGIPLNELTANRILELAAGRYSIPKPLPAIEDVMPGCDKVHAACRHAGTNTRLRDYYDLYVYATRGSLDPDRLRHAFAHTWELFGDSPPSNVEDLVSYGHDFVKQNAARWDELRQRSGWSVDVPDLQEVVTKIRQTISPVLSPGSLHRPAA